MKSLRPLVTAGVGVVVIAGALAFTPPGQHLLPDLRHQAYSALDAVQSKLSGSPVQKGAAGNAPSSQSGSGAAQTPKPDPYMTRAQFAHQLATSFALPDAWSNPFSDVGADFWARGAIDAVVQAGWMTPASTSGESERFAPNAHVTTGDALDGVLKALQIPGDLRAAKLPSTATATASSTAKSAPLFGVQVARLIGVWPKDQPFDRNQPLTPAEAGKLIDAAKKLSSVRGNVVSIDTKTNSMTVRDDSQATHTLSLDKAFALVRNTLPAPLNSLMAGDSTYSLTDGSGHVLMLAARGQITQNDLVDKLSGMTKGVLTPDVLKSVLDGNWSAAEKSLSGVAYDRLVGAGATQDEAKAAVDQNWSKLRSLLIDQGAHALGTQLGVEPSLVNSLLAQNWTQARSQAETELAQQLLSQYMNAPSTNPSTPAAQSTGQATLGLS